MRNADIQVDLWITQVSESNGVTRSNGSSVNRDTTWIPLNLRSGCSDLSETNPPPNDTCGGTPQAEGSIPFG